LKNDNKLPKKNPLVDNESSKPSSGTLHCHNCSLLRRLPASYYCMYTKSRSFHDKWSSKRMLIRRGNSPLEGFRSLYAIGGGSRHEKVPQYHFGPVFTVKGKVRAKELYEVVVEMLWTLCD
jgi:hypothetical protein